MNTPNQPRWTSAPLTIARDGEWLYEGLEITHPGIVENLRGGLRQDEAGYFIQAGQVRVSVEVRDAPFLVVRVEGDGRALRLTLNDGTRELLDPATLRYDARDVPYCWVKGGQFEARLSRAAAWQLARFMEYDEGTGRVTLRLGGMSYPLNRT